MLLSILENILDLPELAQWFGPVKSTDLEPILTTNVSVSSDVLNRQINFIANYTKYTNENLDQLFFIINGLLVLCKKNFLIVVLYVVNRIYKMFVTFMLY